VTHFDEPNKESDQPCHDHATLICGGTSITVIRDTYAALCCCDGKCLYFSRIEYFQKLRFQLFTS
jgi:hypothetical protein